MSELILEEDILELYANDKQQAFLANTAKRRTLVAGRGFGKSFTIGYLLGILVTELPQGKVALAGINYNSLLTKTLPSVMKAIKAHGFTEYHPKNNKRGHYVLFKRPPAKWDEPWEKPYKFDYAITFWTGFTIELLSLYGPDSNRGGSYDGLFGDESALIPEEDWNKVLSPMVRANSFRYRGNPYHWLKCDFTSAPWLLSGQWVYKTEDLMGKYPDDFFFIEGTVYDNEEVLTKEYIRQQKRSTPGQIWDVEYMNKRLKRLSNTFYPAFSDTRHCKFDAYSYTQDSTTGLWLSESTAIDPNLPLASGWDFNAGICTVVLGQERGNILAIPKALYAMPDDLEPGEEKDEAASPATPAPAEAEQPLSKEEEEEKNNLILKLCKVLIKELQGHKRKQITLYGDPGGSHKNPTSNVSAYDLIKKHLQAAGWIVVDKVRPQYPSYQSRHILIDTILSEKEARLPRVRINADECKYLIISMNHAGMDANFKKNKSSERNLSDQRKATHFSDGFDYLLDGLYSSAMGYSSGGGSVESL